MTNDYMGHGRLLRRIVDAYDVLVNSELAGKQDAIEAARGALVKLIDDAKGVLGLPVRGGPK
jgi:hypothetical protein